MNLSTGIFDFFLFPQMNERFECARTVAPLSPFLINIPQKYQIILKWGREFWILIENGLTFNEGKVEKKVENEPGRCRGKLASCLN